MEKEKKAERWSVCRVSGWITAVDPGCVNTSAYPMEYKREELRKGSNLTYYNEYLPTVTVREIADDHIVLFADGVRHTIYTGQRYSSPRKGLSYAYSEVDVRIDVE